MSFLRPYDPMTIFFSPSTTTCTPACRPSPLVYGTDDEAAGPTNLEDHLGESDDALIDAIRPDAWLPGVAIGSRLAVATLYGASR
ncbi:hypothetical protein ACIRH0_13060 [Streptomyces sp. NPDC093675]|uniref:hypothetical protein n=1 Tax=Streptomyces sp. NPDC093675 TaxID=3366049 RepID=UPI00381E3790